MTSTTFALRRTHNDAMGRSEEQPESSVGIRMCVVASLSLCVVVAYICQLRSILQVSGDREDVTAAMSSLSHLDKSKDHSSIDVDSFVQSFAQFMATTSPTHLASSEASAKSSQSIASVIHPYIIHDGALHARPEHLLHVLTSNSTQSTKYRGRIRPFESVVACALHIAKTLASSNVTMDDSNSTTMSTHLHEQSLLQHLVGNGSRLPLLFYGGDFAQCDPAIDYPLFTVAALSENVESNTCSHFAVPCGSLWRHLRFKWLPVNWDPVMRERNVQYPWDSKISKAVWRGSTTGHYENDDWKALPRARLVEMGISNPHLLDAAFTSIVQRSATNERTRENILQESRVVRPMSFTDFMQYKAIVDIDGNSWSSRFADLLCMNSVVIKVEPGAVDYFYPTLVPWLHYVPVQRDLSDLVNIVTFVLADVNRELMQNIVRSANAWCRGSLTRTRLGLDTLRVLLSYLDMLTRSNLMWHRKWMFNTIASAQGMPMVRVGEEFALSNEELRIFGQARVRKLLLTGKVITTR